MSMFVFIIGALLMLIFSLFGALMFPLYAPPSYSTVPSTSLSLSFSGRLAHNARAQVVRGR